MTALPSARAAQVANGYAYTTLFGFGSPIWGGAGSPSLVLGEAEDIYGTTAGTLYRYSPSTNAYSTLVNFGSPVATGLWPGGLVLDSKGDLYGATLRGGSYPGGASGTLFRYSTSTNTYTTLHNFDPSGWNPAGDLTIGKDGSIYGTTMFGGNNGTLFRYDPLTDSFATLVEFATGSIAGEYPNGSLIVGADGNLFGTTGAGGANGGGTIFQYNPATGDFSTLVDFDTPGVRGNNPNSGLTADAAGVLYGTTSTGGINGEGTLYSYDPSTGSYTTVVDFHSPTAPGYGTGGNLTLGKDGSIYGTTAFGIDSETDPGLTPGTLYRYDPLTHTYSTIVQFDEGQGNPIGNMKMASDGSLYGMTISGSGTVFRLAIVPEASSLVLAISAFGLIGGFALRRRKR